MIVTWFVSSSCQVCQTSDPNVGLVCSICYQIKWLKVVAKNYRKYTGILPRAVKLSVPQNVCVFANSNFFDLIYKNYNTVMDQMSTCNSNTSIIVVYVIVEWQLLYCKKQHSDEVTESIDIKVVAVRRQTQRCYSQHSPLVIRTTAMECYTVLKTICFKDCSQYRMQLITPQVSVNTSHQLRGNCNGCRLDAVSTSSSSP